VALVRKAGVQRRERGRDAGQQQALRVFQPHRVQVDVRRHAEVLGEGTAQVHPRQPGLARQLGHRQVARRLGADVVAHAQHAA